MSRSASTSPKIAAARIPSITALRNELDYGGQKLPRCAAFYDDTRAFRKKFRTSHGIAGVDLHDWKSREGQTGLTEMTFAYLDKEGNGRLFWPDDETSPNYNRYQYSKDSVRIRRLVKQLFFRLNQQQFRNVKYKHKDGQESKALETEKRGDSVQTAIDVDSIEPSPLVSPSLVQSDAPTLFDEPSRVGNSSTTADGLFDRGPRHDEEHSSMNRIVLSATDVYDGPQSNAPSPPQMRQFEVVNQPPRTKRGTSPALTSVQDRQPKRQKRQAKQPYFEAASSETPPTSLNTDPIRKSPRGRRLEQREGFMSPQMVASGPELREPSSPRHTSPHEVQATIFRNPDDTAAEPARRDMSTDRSLPLGGPSSSTALKLPVSPNIGREAETPQHPDQPDGVQAPTTSSNVGESGDCPPGTGQSKSPLPDPSTPLTPTTPSKLGGKGTSSGSSGAGNPSVKFIYRVVLTRTPRTLTESWDPQDRFQDKTLAELLKELPFDKGESQGLIFTIESACMKTVERIPHDDEDKFASMKRYINLGIREWFKRQRRLASGKPLPRLVVDILIERITNNEESKLGGEEEEDEDFDIEW